MNIDLFTNIAWVLINFFWQGFVIALATGLALQLIGRHNSHGRYMVALISLLLMILAPVITIILVFSPHPQMPTSDLLMIGKVYADDFDTIPVRQWLAVLDYDAYLPVVTFIWIAGVIWFASKYLLGTYKVYYIRAHHLQAVSEELRLALESVSKVLGVSRPIQMFSTPFVSVPCVMGVWRPVILFPLSGLTGLSATQLELIIAHEVAHIRRYDYLVNVFQCMVEVLLFFHPAVHWVSKLIREERENCCDEIALGHKDKPLEFAQALLSLADDECERTKLSLAATDGDFVCRIKRLLGDKHRYAFSSQLAALIILLSSALSVFAYSMQQVPATVLESGIEEERVEYATKRSKPSERNLYIRGMPFTMKQFEQAAVGSSVEVASELAVFADDKVAAISVGQTKWADPYKVADIPESAPQSRQSSTKYLPQDWYKRKAQISRDDMSVKDELGGDEEKVVAEPKPAAQPRQKTIPEVVDYPALSHHRIESKTTKASLVPNLVLKSTKPIRYPNKARKEGVSGYVVVNYQVLPTGEVKNVVILKSEPVGVFEKSVRKKVRKWRYEPYQPDNAPPRSVTQRIEFKQYTVDNDKKMKSAERCYTGSRICRSEGRFPTRNVITLANTNITH